MPIALATQSQPGFAQPLELMKDRHRRTQRCIDVRIRVIDEGSGDPLPAEHRRTLGELHAAYRRHIRVEDEDIFPLDGRRLSDAQMEAIGREMETRRA